MTNWEKNVQTPPLEPNYKSLKFTIYEHCKVLWRQQSIIHVYEVKNKVHKMKLFLKQSKSLSSIITEIHKKHIFNNGGDIQILNRNFRAMYKPIVFVDGIVNRKNSPLMTRQNYK